jgi:hypothetical protein
MAINQYVLGKFLELDCAFTDQGGAPVDPTVVTAAVLTPDGVTTPLATSRLSLGQWKANFQTTQPGYHKYRFVGTGAVAAADEQTFNVVSSFRT